MTKLSTCAWPKLVHTTLVGILGKKNSMAKSVWETLHILYPSCRNTVNISILKAQRISTMKRLVSFFFLTHWCPNISDHKRLFFFLSSNYHSTVIFYGKELSEGEARYFIYVK